METVFVYYLDIKSKAEVPLGTLTDRRKEERGDNTTGMVRLARKEFAKKPFDGSGIYISPFRYE